jgi:muconolactone delta-isomerase
MLHMVILRHAPESCPGRASNEAFRPCANDMASMLAERGVSTVGRWADPPAHVNYLVLDAPNAHVIQDVLMESGMFEFNTAEVRPILSMD